MGYWSGERWTKVALLVGRESDRMTVVPLLVGRESDARWVGESCATGRENRERGGQRLLRWLEVSQTTVVPLLIMYYYE